MSDIEAQAFYSVYVPTFMERLWRRCGFVFHLGETEPDKAWAGWWRTESYLHFALGDRIRLLVSGKLKLSHTFHMDTPTPNEIHTRMDWQIEQP